MVFAQLALRFVLNTRVRIYIFLSSFSQTIKKHQAGFAITVFGKYHSTTWLNAVADVTAAFL